MVFSDGLTKANDLMELLYLFWTRPGRTVRTAKIAHALGVAPRTARKYINELSATGRLPVIRHDHGWRLADGARIEVFRPRQAGSVAALAPTREATTRLDPMAERTDDANPG